MNTKISVFSAAISRHPLLSHDQERTASKQELVLSKIRLVMVIAKKYTSDSDEYEDFVSEGLTGLMKVAEKYTWREGSTFSTYAGFWIRSAIRRSIETVRDTFLVLSPRERDILCRNTAAGKSGAGESLSDIGKKYGISKERVRQIRNVASEKVCAYLSEA
jgi:DNA-directed RNA polymerase sigma subunit (sigma70/sigma32)